MENVAPRLAGVIRESIVDGPGIRMAVFTQGCPHRCEGCHNPETHDPKGGYDGNIANIIDAFDADPLLAGITLSGGEPFVQAEALLPLAKQVVERGKNIVIFTGYTFEELLDMAGARPAILELLKLTYMLIDGRFEIERRNLALMFRGSENQRIIDVQSSLETKSIVLLKQYMG